MQKTLCQKAESFFDYELLIASIAVAIAVAATIIFAIIKISIAAAVIAVGEIMYPDYYNCDYHNDPK